MYKKNFWSFMVTPHLVHSSHLVNGIVTHTKKRFSHNMTNSSSVLYSTDMVDMPV